MIPGIMVQDLIGRQIEIWLVGKSGGPTFMGKLEKVIVGDPLGRIAHDGDVDEDELLRSAPVAFLVVRDIRKLEMRVAAEHVTAVVCLSG